MLSLRHGTNEELLNVVRKYSFIRFIVLDLKACPFKDLLFYTTLDSSVQNEKCELPISMCLLFTRYFISTWSAGATVNHVTISAPGHPDPSRAAEDRGQGETRGDSAKHREAGKWSPALTSLCHRCPINVCGAASEEEPTGSFALQKREDRLRKFRELHMKRNEAHKLNRQEVEAEEKRQKLPSNWETKKARLEYDLMVYEKKKECEARGEDYDRVKLLDISAEDAERRERKKKKQQNPDPGFAGYAEAQLRQYHRLTKQIKPDMEGYERQREECGEDFHPTTNSLIHGTHVPAREAIDRMQEDIEKQ
ncbi:Pre-mRNA-splicing factor syf2 [Bagarius yarrelli]|uniref:Pre-mRNA-splicing factor SYF2 n=1 Tax=Bagarius yarrelli TaxID=175774 RepID=A0A556V434_BAGYA|nr:Pre-mRNA-splicing factor syf2 [Bagarius yarrelli]